MKIYVDELPKTTNECPFQNGGICALCGMDCHIEKCTCLIPFTVSFEEGDDRSAVD